MPLERISLSTSSLQHAVLPLVSNKSRARTRGSRLVRSGRRFELYFEGNVLAPALNPAAAVEIAELVDSEDILRKYAVALAVRVGKRLDFGAGLRGWTSGLDFGIAPVQNAQALIKLRNGVVHFRPEWSGEKDKHDKLSGLLQHKFAPSPFFAGEGVFPRAWASHAFAVWALKSAVSFLEYFFQEAGLESPLNRFSGHLSELSANAL